MEQIVQPRKTEEYVQAIACRWSVKVEDLRSHTVERLKELWAVLKPKNASTILLSGWKKYD